MENSHINYEDKKSLSLRSLIYNPLFKIKKHKFILPFYLKDLLSI